ncbi:MAG: T9SS type A sorting domain-containing protein, partial [Calditrichaeota bacterium]|nr:T9SS type A sorting domain-containing protein [Calditrichota bacterium]
YYKIEDVSSSGYKTMHGPVVAKIEIPKKFDLSQNYPNPFNPATTIRYQLPQVSKVQLQIYNIMGQLVRTLVDGEKEPGYHAVTWDGHNNTGMSVGSGIYYYRLIAGEHVMVKKMALLH